MNTNQIVAFIVIAVILLGAYGAHIIHVRFRHEFIVNDGLVAVLYHHGKRTGELAPGRHIRWGRNYHVAIADMRKAKVAGGKIPAAENFISVAQIIEQQPVLATLRFLQAISAAGMNPTFAINDLTALAPIMTARAVKRAGPVDADEA